MNKLSKKERRERAKKKIETLRDEILSRMIELEKSGLNSHDCYVKINQYIGYMGRRNPQEKHLVSSACSDIRQMAKEAREERKSC